MRSIQSQRIINMAIKQNNNLTNGVRTGYSDLQTNKCGFYRAEQKFLKNKKQLYRKTVFMCTVYLM